jgi:hypothetical protein
MLCVHRIDAMPGPGDSASRDDPDGENKTRAIRRLPWAGVINPSQNQASPIEQEAWLGA